MINRNSRAGFTLVEMLLVLVILATLAAIVIPKLAGRGQQAKETAAKTQIAAFETALNQYELDTGAYPAGNAGLNALVEAPGNLQGWKGPYLKNIPNDDWGHPYVYTFPPKFNSGSPDIASAGADGQAGTDDDINNWTKK